jgi:hypothetical protein
MSTNLKRRNRINEQFSARPIAMLESPAYRALSRCAHLVISRIEVELAHHGGNDNGRLPVTTDQFVKFGMHRGSVASAIREAEALGFIRITERGRAGNAEHGAPNRFFLTFAHGRNSRQEAPTHDWRRIKTPEEAEEIARVARAEKNPGAVAHGKRSWRSRHAKINPGTENSQASVRENRTETTETPVRENRTTGQSKKPYYIYILGEGAHNATAPTPNKDAPTPAPLQLNNTDPKPKPAWTMPVLTEMPYTAALRRLYAAEMAKAALSEAAAA